MVSATKQAQLARIAELTAEAARLQALVDASEMDAAKVLTPCYLVKYWQGRLTVEEDSGDLVEDGSLISLAGVTWPYFSRPPSPLSRLHTVAFASVELAEKAALSFYAAQYHKSCVLKLSYEKLELLAKSRKD